MKKIVSIITIFLILFVTSFSLNVYAAELTGINITTTKTTVHPTENVTVNIEFGQELGSYTFDVAYDSNLFEYVSSEGGTANDTGDKVIVTFYDTTGGTNPRSNMSVTFKAKYVTTSNPTDFSITATGLANADATTVFDDITTPIIKNVVVEPDYEDYNIKLNYTGDVIKNVEKDMKLVVSSSMGRSYEHTRIIAEATTPEGATAKLLATDSATAEHDIIQSGWGPAEGEAIGGKDVVKELNVRGLFSNAGNYSITFKLIDRDNSDDEITSKTVNITVKETATTTPDTDETEKPSEDQEPNQNQGQNGNQNTTGNGQTELETMPQTGNTVYMYVIPTLLVLSIAYVVLRKKN